MNTEKVYVIWDDRDGRIRIEDGFFKAEEQARYHIMAKLVPGKTRYWIEEIDRNKDLD